MTTILKNHPSMSDERFAYFVCAYGAGVAAFLAWFLPWVYEQLQAIGSL